MSPVLETALVTIAVAAAAGYVLVVLVRFARRFRGGAAACDRCGSNRASEGSARLVSLEPTRRRDEESVVREGS